MQIKEETYQALGLLASKRELLVSAARWRYGGLFGHLGPA